jgi:eukaryotic-like serine/threonine-protein kinase
MTEADLARVGTVLDEKWTLERLLGEGGMGAVYAGRHRNGARAAVKVLHPMLSLEPEVRERFLREGYAANRVDHKGAVKVLDDDVIAEGPEQGTAYLVMELLEGESLHDRAKRSPTLTEHELLEIAEQVLEVLVAAHGNGVVHRDLKPENLFLARASDEDRVRVKVLDFGLARLSDGGAATNAGRAIGTPAFMSPEQAGGKVDQIDGQTDIFALGATLFRVIAGRRVHEGDNPVQVLVKMQREAAPKLATVVGTVSEEFASVVDRALAFEKRDRFASAVEMLEAVRATRKALGCGAPSENLLPPLPAAAVDTSAIVLASADVLAVGSQALEPQPLAELPQSPPHPASTARASTLGFAATMSAADAASLVAERLALAQTEAAPHVRPTDEPVREPSPTLDPDARVTTVLAERETVLDERAERAERETLALPENSAPKPEPGEMHDLPRLPIVGFPWVPVGLSAAAVVVGIALFGSARGPAVARSSLVAEGAAERIPSASPSVAMVAPEPAPKTETVELADPSAAIRGLGESAAMPVSSMHPTQAGAPHAATNPSAAKPKPKKPAIVPKVPPPKHKK